MKTHRARTTIIIAVLVAVGLLAAGCVYYNMFFNAKKKFDQAEQQGRRLGGSRAAPQRRVGNLAYQDAIEHFGKIIDRHPNSKWVDDAYYYIGLGYFRMGEFDKAQRSFNQIIENHPKSKYVEEAGFWIAACRVELGERLAGRERLRKLAATATKMRWRAEAWSRLADMYLEDEEYDSAAAAYLTVAEEYSSEEIGKGARFKAGEALTLAGRGEEALEQFYLTLREEPSQDLIYRTRIRMADAYFGHDQIDSGLVLLEALAKSDLYFDSLGVLQLKIGGGLERAQRIEEAIEIYNDVTETFPKTAWAAEAYYRIGYVHQKKFFDFPAARDFYQKAKQEFARSEFAKKAINQSVTLATIEGYQEEITKGLADLYALDNPIAAAAAAAAAADTMTPADSSGVRSEADSTGISDTTLPADSATVPEVADSLVNADSAAVLEVADSLVNADSVSIPDAADSTTVVDSITLTMTDAAVDSLDTSSSLLVELANEMTDSTDTIPTAESAGVPDSLTFPDSGVVAADTTVMADTVTQSGLVTLPDTLADSTAVAEEIQTPDDPNRTADTTITIDTLLVIDTTYAFDTALVANIAPTTQPEAITDSLPAPDSTVTSDSTAADIRTMARTSDSTKAVRPADSIAPPDSTAVPDSTVTSDSTAADIRTMARTSDSTKAVPPADSIAMADSTALPDSTWAMDSTATPMAPDSATSGLPVDSAAVTDSIMANDTMLVRDTTLLMDSVATADPVGEVEPLAQAPDSAAVAPPAYVVDTTMFFDSTFVVDTTLVIELTAAAKKALAEKEKRDAIIDKLATAYFNLAQAYHTVLDEPDSALYYYDTLIFNFPTSTHIPRALFSSAALLGDYFKDSAAAAEKYRRVLTDFGRTDYAGAAIERLGLVGTPADTGYPGAAYRHAEQILFEEKRPDSARALFEKIAREFPKSIYGPKATYASLIAAEELYQGEDSTVYLLYATFIDSFPGTPYAEDAKTKIGSGIAPRPERQRAVMASETDDAAYDSALAAIEAEQADTTIVRLPPAPRPKQAGVFEYPESELGHEPWKGAVIFKILIDFTGRITEYELVGPSNRPDIDLNATTAVEETFFDPDSIAPESLNMWYQYEVRVIPPAQDRENIFDDPLYENR